MSLFEVKFYDIDKEEQFIKTIEVDSQFFTDEFHQTQQALRVAFRMVRENKGWSFLSLTTIAIA